MKITVDEARAFLHTRYPLLGEIADDLEGRGLRLIRFSRSEHKGQMCGSLKFAGLPDDYVLAFALQPSDVRLFRCKGKGGLIPIRLAELSTEAVATAFWNDALR